MLLGNTHLHPQIVNLSSCMPEIGDLFLASSQVFWRIMLIGLWLEHREKGCSVVVEISPVVSGPLTGVSWYCSPSLIPAIVSRPACLPASHGLPLYCLIYFKVKKHGIPHTACFNYLTQGERFFDLRETDLLNYFSCEYMGLQEKFISELQPGSRY